MSDPIPQNLFQRHLLNILQTTSIDNFHSVETNAVDWSPNYSHSNKIEIKRQFKCHLKSSSCSTVARSRQAIVSSFVKIGEISVSFKKHTHTFPIKPIICVAKVHFSENQHSASPLLKLAIRENNKVAIYLAD